MLFNSHPFIFLYLPLTVLLFYLAARRSAGLAAGWLGFASLLFYAWWDWHNLPILLGSILFNFLAGIHIGRLVQQHRNRRAGVVTAVAITVNLALLGYYKYSNFFLTELGHALQASWSIPQVVLPLGISFFTFTQIAYLVDVRQGKVQEYDFTHYLLFVTYFPHLIAGPILHHGEMMPQFAHRETYRFSYDKLALGLTIFLLGLFKKTVIADGVAPEARLLFDAAARGEVLGLLECWSGVLAYTLQLYFDFSGYSDMAVGLSCLFGIRLPINFYSPYQSTNIIEFWRRWHMSLSRFLRDYLYIPLGGNRHGKLRRYFNLFVTMLLGGLWHGANWTFVVWGGLHGAFLAINHGWRALRERLGADLSHSTAAGRIAGGALTLLAVMVAWVFFRADTLGSAWLIVKGLAGTNGMTLPYAWIEHREQASLAQWLLSHHVRFAEMPLFGKGKDALWCLILMVACWVLPNTQQMFEQHKPGFCPSRLGRPVHARWHWRIGWVWAVATVIAGFAAILSISGLSEFIYFQF